jgi:FkbM family methyltransferase
MITNRPLSVILAASNQGTLILNRNDQHRVDDTHTFGVGHQILTQAAYDQSEVGTALTMLDWLREFRGDGVVAIDCGANVGVHTISFARHMTHWGKVVAYEAQERIFYALAGNVCLNNCLNARVFNAAVGDQDGIMSVPVPNYNSPGSFGSLELVQRAETENIGQAINYGPEAMQSVRAIRLDGTGMPRVDFLKIDVEGMELPVLRGAGELIARCRPYMLIEHIKTDRVALNALLATLGYQVWVMGMNTLALPADDPCVQRITQA